MAPKKVAMLTAGGLAPCLSSCVASLIESYHELLPETEIYCYMNGFRALPISDKLRVTPEMIRQVHRLHTIGGSPIGNSRVSLDNPEDCYKRGLISQGENPWHVACDSLVNDGIEVIHPIGGDGTSIGAARLAKITKERHEGYHLSVIGLPKTIDNDIIPISQSLGAHTAAKESAKFFRNVVGENTGSSHFLLVHEVMGRNCGYLAAEATRMYKEMVKEMIDLTGMDYKRDVHALYIPEMQINFEGEVNRLRNLMKRIGCVNIFVSEGACLDIITKQIEDSGENVERDQTGNIKLSKINVGEWMADNLGKKIGATKTLVQKSGYFSRASPADSYDKELIKKCCRVAVQEAIKHTTGIVGPNENNQNKIELIPLSEIKGGKCFDITQKWFKEMLHEMGQTIRFNPLRVISLPTSSSIVETPNEGFFVHKNKDSAKKLDNEVNFAFAHSALLSISEIEEERILNLLKLNKKDVKPIEPSEQKALAEILMILIISFKYIANLIRQSGVLGDDSTKKAFNVLNQIASETILKGLKTLKTVKGVMILGEDIERMNEEKETEHSFDIYCDALDGTKNIKANVSTGTVFGVYNNKRKGTQSGRSQLLSGYCLYGTAVVLVLSFSKRVVHLKLDPNRQVFELKSENVRINSTGNIFSANLGYYLQWDEKVQRFVEGCLKRKRNFRYIGSMVADVHRTLFYGGVFFYPANNEFPNGKLKLMTEANPLAYVIENAGGRATSGQKDICRIEPKSKKDNTPFFAGSSGIVKEIEKLYQ